MALWFRPEDHGQMHELEPSCTDRLAYSIPNFAKAVDLSVDTIRKAMDNGDLLPSYPTRAGRKPIITHEEGLRWLRSLSQESPRYR
ncbi:hypothetical protein DEJ30_09065 [Curtobacterium sp. MCPF17_003]|nr:hypothetical protein DEJ30_09065 [Curtobacterium sp. MCPF17_003]